MFTNAENNFIFRIVQLAHARKILVDLSVHASYRFQDAYRRDRAKMWVARREVPDAAEIVPTRKNCQAVICQRCKRWQKDKIAQFRPHHDYFPHSTSRATR